MMKSFFFILMMTSLFCLTTIESKAIHKEIDGYITSSDGCRWHIKGHVNYSLFPPSLNSYDISVSGPCGKYRFVGVHVSAGEGTNGTNVEMHLYQSNRFTEVPLEKIDYMAVYYLLKEQIRSER